MMKDVEELLKVGKLQTDKLEVPLVMEESIRMALKTRTSNKNKKLVFSMRAAAVLIAFLLISYNYDTLAYFGKKIIGYDTVISGTLNKLNELGRGQTIGKSYMFKEGTSITLDGTMLDDNVLILFYTLKNKSGNVDKINFSPMIYVKGRFGQYIMNNGYGEMNDEKTEIKYIGRFKVPLFFERNLSFEFSLEKNKVTELGEIIFKLDRSKAMGHTLKKSIGKSVRVDETSIRFETITASPTSTVIKGKLQNILQLASDVVRDERFRPSGLNIELLANGKAIPVLSGGMSTDMKGITFHREYDALPINLKILQLRLVSFGADHDVHGEVLLLRGGGNQSINLLKQNIDINKVYKEKGNIYITISSEESVVLTRVYLIIDGKKTELEKTISDNTNKLTDGTIIHTRTLVFKGNGDANVLKLDIQRMKYEKVYNKLIEIPIN